MELNAEKQGAAGGLAVEEFSDFDRMLQKEFSPKTDQARVAVESAVRTLAEQALHNAVTVSDDAIKTIQSMIAEIDAKLTAQVNQIIHHEDFQKVESAWRGLSYLVNNTQTDETLKIKYINVSKDDLRKTLKRYKGTAWDQSPIFKQIYEEEFGKLGGAPYGCLVGDYYFDQTEPDVAMLGEIAKIASAAHAPFISAVSPTVLQMNSWQELSNPRDLTKIFQSPEYASWRSLRESEDAKYLGLTLPRFLARVPYGAKTNPVEGFAFEEDTASEEGDDSHNKYSWANSAYAMATNINRSFKEYGWCSRIRGIESGGAVTNLPVHSFETEDGTVDMKCPTETSISDRRELELANNGFMPLLHKKNSDFAAFIGAQSLHKPTEFDDPDASANARLGARLPYLFATCRFAHYLKVMAREKVGSFKSAESMRTWLQDWILQYVDGDPDNSTEATKARKPLAHAEVVVEEVEGNPGFYTSKFYLRPHYQLEGMTVSLRLVSKLPSQKAGG